ncbi:PHB depolymerase family esterase [Frankia sp. AgKG'84/4]|uniref:PHB depolymerase family esterase n=1 Tax=Frankia sp. AgKG'84/4 TaxID=573490 RepID=UPI00200E15F5|nr:PHB depolymerase family esterase [Frankia sp. AgKG'84/4]MCL9795705.1 plasmid partitioning protein [Frankia sp. AgKG'84/4]
MWFGVIVASNPLAGWWGKNKRTAYIVLAVIVVLFVFVNRGGGAKTKRVEMPKDYGSAGRELLVHAPAHPKKPIPLVLILHDDNLDAKTLDHDSGAGSVANSRDFAVAYPEAVGGTWRIDSPDGADAQYLRDVVAYVSAKKSKIDPNRVYVWGVGEGARLALTTVCATGKPVFAAVGVVGQFAQEPQSPCGDRVPKVRAADIEWKKKVSEALWEASSKNHRAA